MSGQTNDQALIELSFKANALERALTDAINQSEIPAWLAVLIMEKTLLNGICGNLKAQLDALTAGRIPGTSDLQ